MCLPSLKFLRPSIHVEVMRDFLSRVVCEPCALLSKNSVASYLWQPVNISGKLQHSTILLSQVLTHMSQPERNMLILWVVTLIYNLQLCKSCACGFCWNGWANISTNFTWSQFSLLHDIKTKRISKKELKQKTTESRVCECSLEHITATFRSVLGISNTDRMQCIMWHPGGCKIMLLSG